MDSTARSKEKAHENVKLEPYDMSLKKVLIMPNEGGVLVEEVKRQQGIRLKCDDSGLLLTQERSQYYYRSWSAGSSCGSSSYRVRISTEGYYPTRLVITMAGYLGVSVNGSESICSYEINFMDMGCALVEQ
eukprot:Gb_29185 [translate_table: standard]